MAEGISSPKDLLLGLAVMLGVAILFYFSFTVVSYAATFILVAWVAIRAVTRPRGRWEIPSLLYIPWRAVGRAVVAIPISLAAHVGLYVALASFAVLSDADIFADALAPADSLPVVLLSNAALSLLLVLAMVPLRMFGHSRFRRRYGEAGLAAYSRMAEDHGRAEQLEAKAKVLGARQRELIELHERLSREPTVFENRIVVIKDKIEATRQALQTISELATRYRHMIEVLRTDVDSSVLELDGVIEVLTTDAGLHSHEHTELDERFEQLTYLAEAEKELAEMLEPD